ncbi:MAG: hypothetical protein Q9175_005345 [Cornicularia normoerica]
MRNGEASYIHEMEETFVTDKAAINVFDDYQKHNAALQGVEGEVFIVYAATFQQGFGQVKNNYVLHKRDHELFDGCCMATDELLAAATMWNNNVHDEVLVFDQERWTKNKESRASVQNARWDDVILDKDMEETLVNDVEGFFDCRDDYKEFSVP